MELLRRWQAMQTIATAAVIALGMLVTSAVSYLMRAHAPGPNPFDVATVALAGFAFYQLAKPVLTRKPAPKWDPTPDLWDV